MLSTIMLVVHGILMMGTLALTYDYYGNLDISLPEIVPILVYAGVFGVSVLWALGYAALGISFGIAAGGLLEGLKMGGILGIGLSVGRLWPYLLSFSVGSFLCAAATSDTVLSLFAAIVCFAVNLAIKFIWGVTTV